MKYLNIFIFLALVVWVSISESHIIGVSAWCVANSAVHFECFFSEPERCEQEAKHRSKMGENWQCVPFPVDFRNIPKSGETAVPPEKNLTK